MTSYYRRSWSWGWSGVGLLLRPEKWIKGSWENVYSLSDFLQKKSATLLNLIDAEVSHPENNWAGHELSLGSLRRRRTEGSAGRRVYLTWREKKKVCVGKTRWMTKKHNSREGGKQCHNSVLQWETSVPRQRCVSPHQNVRKHTAIPGSRHQQHCAGGCACGLQSSSEECVSLSPTAPPPAPSWLPREPYTSSLRDTGGQKTHRGDVLWVQQKCT